MLYVIVRRPFVRVVRNVVTIAAQGLAAAAAGLATAGFASAECGTVKGSALPFHSTAAGVLAASAAFVMMGMVLDAVAAVRVFQTARRRRLLKDLEHFVSADRDGSGRLNREELREGLQAMRGRPVSDRQLEATFAQLGTDGSGAVSLREFLDVEYVVWELPAEEAGGECGAGVAAGLSVPLRNTAVPLTRGTGRGEPTMLRSPVARQSPQSNWEEGASPHPQFAGAARGAARIHSSQAPLSRHRRALRGGKCQTVSAPLYSASPPTPQGRQGRQRRRTKWRATRTDSPPSRTSSKSLPASPVFPSTFHNLSSLQDTQQAFASMSKSRTVTTGVPGAPGTLWKSSLPVRSATTV